MAVRTKPKSHRLTLIITDPMGKHVGKETVRITLPEGADIESLQFHFQQWVNTLKKEA